MYVCLHAHLLHHAVLISSWFNIKVLILCNYVLKLREHQCSIYTYTAFTIHLPEDRRCRCVFISNLYMIIRLYFYNHNHFAVFLFLLFFHTFKFCSGFPAWLFIIWFFFLLYMMVMIAYINHRYFPHKPQVVGSNNLPANYCYIFSLMPRKTTLFHRIHFISGLKSILQVWIFYKL